MHREKSSLILLLTILFVIVLPSTGLSGRIAPPDPDPGHFYVASYMQGVVDGKLNEWHHKPLHLASMRNARYTAGKWKGRGDCSATCWLGWNEAGLLIGTRVVDDSIAFPFQDEQLWQNDCVQIAIDVYDDNNPDSYDNDDREFVITIQDTTPVVYEYGYGEYRTSGLRNFPCKIIRQADTLNYEALIPWAELGLSGPRPGNYLAISIVIFDNDGNQVRGHLEWTAGIADRKFTLPFANVLLYSPTLGSIQAIVHQPFYEVNDSLVCYLYSYYARRSVTCQLMDDDEVLFRRHVSLKGREWYKLSIPSHNLKSGRLTLLVSSIRTTRRMKINVWSRRQIIDHIAYLVKQAPVLVQLTDVDPDAALLVKYWVNSLQRRMQHATNGFEYFDIMMDAARKVNTVPALFMNQPVFYDREYRLVETAYQSKIEQRIKQYLIYLPPNYDPSEKYPLAVWLMDQTFADVTRIHQIINGIQQFHRPVIAVFIKTYLGEILPIGFPWRIMEQLEHLNRKYPVDPTRRFLFSIGKECNSALKLAERFPDYFAAMALFQGIHRFSKFNHTLLRYTPMFVYGDSSHIAQYHSSFINFAGHNKNFIYIDHIYNPSVERFFNESFYDWLSPKQKNFAPAKISFTALHRIPERLFWIKIGAQTKHDVYVQFDAVLDSNRLFVQIENINEFAIDLNRLPKSVSYPLIVNINYTSQFEINEPAFNHVFRFASGKWRLVTPKGGSHVLQLSRTGPLDRFFSRPVRIVYSTQQFDSAYNRLTVELASRWARQYVGIHYPTIILADSMVKNDKLSGNLLIIGNEQSNRFLSLVREKLPIRCRGHELQFGNSLYSSHGSASVYMYPNPLNPDNYVLVCISPDTLGLQTLQQFFDCRYSNKIYDFDYVLLRQPIDSLVNSYWIDAGHFDANWRLPWLREDFFAGPRYWHGNVLLGLDANQLSLNNNWRGGGNGNFTWKIYTRLEFERRKQWYTWRNKLYCAFGQISIQEKEGWKSPEKSNDVIDFDADIRFTLEKYIDPYFAISMNTQFQDGIDTKTRQIVSQFANPLEMTQSAGIARLLSDKKSFRLMTRIGYAAKEVIANKREFRTRWTGDPTKWIKVDGGVEWQFETRSELGASIRWTNKLKLFQAVFSSISKQKDPGKHWQYLDVKWEQMFTARITKYILLNVMMKFIYDRDVTNAGQFMENASLGISYELKDIHF